MLQNIIYTGKYEIYYQFFLYLAHKTKSMLSNFGQNSQNQSKSKELNQVNQFLGLLGFKDNDIVYLRHINPVTGYTFKTQSKYPLRSLPRRKILVLILWLMVKGIPIRILRTVVPFG